MLAVAAGIAAKLGYDQYQDGVTKEKIALKEAELAQKGLKMVEIPFANEL